MWLKGSGNEFCQGVFGEHDLIELFGIVVYEGLDEGAEGGFLAVFKVGRACPDASREGLKVGESLRAGGGEAGEEVIEGDGEIVGGGVGEDVGDNRDWFFGDAVEAGKGADFDGKQVVKNVGEGPLIGHNARKPREGGEVTEGTREVAGGGFQGLKKFGAAGHEKIILGIILRGFSSDNRTLPCYDWGSGYVKMGSAIHKVVRFARYDWSV